MRHTGLSVRRLEIRTSFTASPSSNLIIEMRLEISAVGSSDMSSESLFEPESESFSFISEKSVPPRVADLKLFPFQSPTAGNQKSSTGSVSKSTSISLDLKPSSCGLRDKASSESPVI